MFLYPKRRATVDTPWDISDMTLEGDLRGEKRLLTSSCLSVRLSVSPQVTTRLTLDGFLWNLIFRYFDVEYIYGFI